jgi:hypothetical protein
MYINVLWSRDACVVEFFSGSILSIGEHVPGTRVLCYARLPINLTSSLIPALILVIFITLKLFALMNCS